MPDCDEKIIGLPDTVNKQRRRWLVATTGLVGAAGLAVLGTPFVEYFLPSQRAKVAGAPVSVDVSKLEPGQQITVAWRGRPVWLLRRTPDILERMSTAHHRSLLVDPDSRVSSQQPTYAQNSARAIRSEYFVVIGICTHLGCVPTFRPDLAPADLGADWIGGYFCPCHGSRFDLAGRVYQNVPAPTNLVVPPYHYVSNTLIEIGVDPVTT